MSLSIRTELNESLSEDFELIKEFLGIENNTDAIRNLIRSKAREIRQTEQLTPNLNIDEKLNTLFYQGYFEEFLEELAEKEPELFDEYNKKYDKKQSKPSEPAEGCT